MRFNLTAILLAFASLSADAQGTPGFGQPSMPAGMSAADCEQLARMPNSPISVATCKSMMGMAAGFEAAASDPSARRPGDDAMACPQIFGELQTVAGAGITDAHVAQSEVVIKESAAVGTRNVAALGAFMVETQALGAALSLMGPYVPNFVQAAIAAAWQAKILALGARMQADQAPVDARINEAMLANAGDLMRSMQANPRFSRLLQLAMAKDCQPPATAAR